MFEAAQLDRKLSKSEYKKIVPKLRASLLELQTIIRRQKHFQVVVLFGGVNGGGKAETVGLLNSWMDPRWLKTRAYESITDYERQWPEFWRYWRDLPPRGQIGMFLSAWYSEPLLHHVYDEIDDSAFHRKLDHIANFERTLARDGTLVLKFWMHLSRDAQEQRLKNLESDPLTAARVSEEDWEHWRMYDKFRDASERLITRTNRGFAPWTLVEGTDENYRSVSVGTALREALQKHVEKCEAVRASRRSLLSSADQSRDAQIPPKKNGKKKKKSDELPEVSADAITIFSRLDMTPVLDKAAFKAELIEQQARLHRLHLLAKDRNLSSVLVFEGPDAAGKGGAIRRVTNAMDARNFQVHAIAAPTDEEARHHYLWRFWRRLGPAGRVSIFDRSWYGRVLVERIENFASEDEWRRAYGEINDFESQLVDGNVLLLKFWIHISPEEQLARFKLREQTPHKHWKLTEEDWRNRDKWQDYEQAANDMIQFTSSSMSPWIIVPGNDKRYARVSVIKTYCDRLAAALGEDA